MTEIKKKIYIEGENVRGVGYRPSILAKALRLRIPNFDAENIEDNGIQKLVISVGGDEEKISEFEKFVNDKKNVPKNAKVSNISTEECISDIMTIEEYRKLLNSEQLNNIVQGGIQLRDDTNQNFKKMDDNFKDLDKKYKLIADGMFAVVDEIKETNKLFEKRMDNTDRNIEHIERNIEKTEKNIEELLKILVQQKK